MKKHNQKRIWGCIIVLICVFFTYKHVYALEPIVDGECKLLPGKSINEDLCLDDNEAKIQKYNVSLKENNDEKAVINWNPQGDYKKVEFKVESINGQAPPKAITIKGTNKKYNLNVSAAQNLTVILTTKQDPDCGCVDITLTLTHDSKGGVIVEPTEIDTYVDTEPNTSSAINCTNYKTKFGATSFEYQYCLTREKAYNTNHWYNLNKKTSFKNYTGKVDNKLSCDTKTFDKKNYYVEKNRRYYYAYNEYTKTIKKAYEYHYAPGNIKYGDATCKVKCYEATVVEYGPPVASKAGLCFEYKVKVTSRVTCESSNPSMYEKKSSYCTPTPLCSNNYGTFNQAGPNEDFNSCIKECDGGKYTEKCSKKCYQEVYNNTKSGNQNMNSLTLYNDNKVLLASSLEDQKKECFKRNKNHKNYYGGCYYVSDGEIKWAQEDRKTWNGAPGRWYPMKSYKNYTEYDVSTDGFYRHDYGSYHCRDVCWWSGCKGDKYLNPADASLDNAANKENYLKAKATCQAAASCTEKTATFTMQVDYTSKEDGKEYTVEYPYTKLTEKKKQPTDSSSLKGNKTNAEGKPPILNYAGCYKDNTTNNFYQTELSFPGTWINSKTGEIQFKEKTATGWYKKKGKFCIPLNAQNVNPEWWNWYMHKYANNSSYMKKEYTDECGTKIKNATYADPTTWNIRAYIRNFGYFGWDFDIKCFYGLNDNPSSQKTPKPTCDTTSPLKYRVRTIDNSDMFPAKDGTKTATNATGRKAGFNWTKEATITSEKNPDYATDPTVLIGQIQKLGDSIYNGDKYLDYQFRLTPETLKKIRTYNEQKIKTTDNINSGGYITWEGKFKVKNGVITYHSDFLRDTNIFKKATSKYGNIGCNNDGMEGSCNSFYLSK